MQHMDAGQSKSVFGPQLARLAARMGTPIQIPTEEGPLWAEIDLTPTIFGRVGLFLLKIPPVTLTLILEDGRIMHHRYIPAMGHRGFLLSPYIQTTDDFATFAAGIHQANRVRSIQFDTSGTGMWHNQFEVRLRRLETEAQLGARKIVLVQPAEPPPQLAHAAADRGSVCQIENANGLPAGTAESVISAQSALKLEGWSVVSERDGIAPDQVWITLTSSDGRCRFYRATEESRPDVKAALGHPNMKDPGFVANVDLADLNGLQKLNVYQVSGDVAFDCRLDRTVNVIATSR